MGYGLSPKYGFLLLFMRENGRSREISMGYWRVWVMTRMGYHRDDCNKFVLIYKSLLILLGSNRHFLHCLVNHRLSPDQGSSNSSSRPKEHGAN